MRYLKSAWMAVSIISLLIACQKSDETQLLFDDNTSDEVGFLGEFVTTEGQTVLGDVIDIPYSIENLLKAYENLPAQTKSQINPEDIQPTHYYVRFYPKSIEEQDILRNIKPYVFLSETPLDRKVVVGGSSYHDPSIPEGLPTFQYTVVPVARWAELERTVPVEAEILIKAYIPDYDEAYSTKSADKYGIPVSAYEALLRKAYEMTGNEYVPETKTSWTPSGKITAYDPLVQDFVPIPGVRVRATHLLKVREALTSVQGQFVMNDTFNNSVTYKVIWESDDWDIRDGSTLQATYDGPSLNTSWYCKINMSNEKNIRFAAIQRAAYHYYNNTYYFLEPVTTQKLKFCQYDSTPSGGDQGSYSSGTHKIDLWAKDGPNSYLSVFAMFYYASRELGHYSLWTWISDYYSNRPDFIKDSWASFVGYLMTEEEYPSYPSSFNWIKKQDWTYSASNANNSSLFIDLYDDYNQQVELDPDYINDDITGFSVNNLFIVTTFTSDLDSLGLVIYNNSYGVATQAEISSFLTQYLQ